MKPSWLVSGGSVKVSHCGREKMEKKSNTNKKMNKLYLFLISFLLVLSSLPLIMAPAGSAVFINPLNDAILGNTTVINVTINNVAGNFSCIFYAGSSLTANITWVNLTTSSVGNNTAGTGGINFTNFTFNTNALEDANNYRFNATCSNDTEMWAHAVTTGIIIDNTRPQSATSPSPASGTIDTDGTVLFNTTVIGVNTTSCTLRFDGANPGNSIYTMTHGGNACWTELTLIPESNYYWFVRTSDETNTTDSSTTRIEIDTQSSAGKLGYLLSQPGAQSLGGAEVLLAEEEVTTTKDNVIGFFKKELIGGIPVWIILLIAVILVIFFIGRNNG